MKIEIDTNNPKVLLVDGETYTYKPEVSCDECTFCDKDTTVCLLCVGIDSEAGGWSPKNAVAMTKKEIASKLGLSEQDLIILND